MTLPPRLLLLTTSLLGACSTAESAASRVLPGLAAYTPAGGARPPVVDIYFSAGEVEGYGAGGAEWDPKDYYGCNRHNITNCSIERVRVSLATGAYLNPEVVVPREKSDSTRSVGMVMPSVNRAGTHLAYRAANTLEPDRNASGTPLRLPSTIMEVHVRDLAGGADQAVGREKSARFPTWYDDETLLYTRSTRDGDALMSAPIPSSLRSGALRTPSLVLGPGSGVKDTLAFDDADVRQGWSPTDTHPPIVSFGKDLSGGGSATVPRVHALAWQGAAARAGTNWQPEPFQLGTVRTMPGQAVRDCQHPSWSVDGASIYCWNHSSRDRWPADNARSLLEMTYRYTWSSAAGAWVQSPEKWAFIPPDPATLAQLSHGLFPAASSASAPHCEVTAYKQASECGSSDYMVMTLFCSDATYNVAYPTFASRVLLVHREPFAYWDLTGLVEAQEGRSLGTVQGIYSACHTVPAAEAGGL